MGEGSPVRRIAVAEQESDEVCMSGLAAGMERKG